MKKIKLSDKTKITKGFNRAVHYYPDHDNFIIKVRLKDTVNNEKSSFKAWMYKAFPATIYRSFYSEIFHELNTQIKADAAGIISPIAPTRGLIDTNLGLGMVMERIGPKEKELGPTLNKLSRDCKLTDAKINALNECVDAMFKLKIICADVNPDNIVWSDATKRFYIVDGFGDRNLIKLKTLFSFLRIKRINRALSTTARLLDLNWSKETLKYTRK